MRRAAAKSDRERTELVKEKTGVFTGSYAINPVNGQPIPIWIADYVLISYGTGAIMAVPAHDTRDFEFAEQFDLPIVAVVDPGEADAGVDRRQVLAGSAVFRGTRHGGQLGPVRRPGHGRVQAADYRRSVLQRDWAEQRSTTSCATGCSAGSDSGANRFPILHELDDEGQPNRAAAGGGSGGSAGRSAAPGRLSSRTVGRSRRW